MELKVLGCHGGETPKHRTSSFLVDERLAIDAGAITSMLTLEEQQRVQSVLVSHSHMDHVRDLATIADNRCQQGGPPLEIVGTPETLRSLRDYFFNDHLWPDFSRINTPQGPTVTFKPINPGESAMVSGFRVTTVLVDHTIETSGFIIEGPDGALGYSGDTGPTEQLWEVIARTQNVRALLMEVSFPNDQAELARVSGHHTPDSLSADLKKLRGNANLPVLLYHIKPVFEAAVEKELARIRNQNLTVLRLGDRFVFE